MNMSIACMPPVQPAYSAQDKAHPRFREYLNYRAAMSSQLVTAGSFPLWLDQTERSENGFTTVFEVTSPDAMLAKGWYKNVFESGGTLHHRNGTFPTQAAAELSN